MSAHVVTAAAGHRCFAPGSERFIVRAVMASQTDRVVRTSRLLVAGVVSAIALAAAGCAIIGGDQDPEPPPPAEQPQPATPRVTASFSSGQTVTYSGPIAVTTGEPFTATICVEDRNGDPVSEMQVFFSLGDPPTSEDATHGSATTDVNGCADIEMDVNWPAGTTVLWFSDGDEVVRGTSMDVT